MRAGAYRHTHAHTDGLTKGRHTPDTPDTPRCRVSDTGSRDAETRKKACRVCVGGVDTPRHAPVCLTASRWRRRRASTPYGEVGNSARDHSDGWGDVGEEIDERRAAPAARCRRPTATSATDERAATEIVVDDSDGSDAGGGRPAAPSRLGRDHSGVR